MIRKSSCIILFSVISFCSVFGTNFFLDPINGNINNTGTQSAPWSSLQEVISADYIETFAYSPLPYDANSMLQVKNSGSQVKGGDTLFLLGGDHGEVFMRNYNNKEVITIIGVEGEEPVLKSLRLQACSHWDIVNITIGRNNTDELLMDKLLYIESHGFQGPSKNINVDNCLLYSNAFPWTDTLSWQLKSRDGIYVRGDSCRITNNTLRNVDMGLSSVGDYNLFEDNKVVNFSGDGLRILGSHSVFRKNDIRNCYNVDDNHDDGIQSFTTNGLVVDNNLVEANIIINFEDPNQPLRGPLQGIGCFDGIYNNWVVRNNLIIVDHWHGISFYGANNCLIINNTVIDPTPDATPGASWIRIADDKDGTPSSDCIVQNNITNKLVVDGQLINNVELINYQEYEEHFVDYVNNDMHLNESSSLVDAGNNNMAPAFDIDGTTRPQGLGIDIGCYEFTPPNNAENFDDIQNLSLFPNPVKNTLFISSEMNCHECFIRIYNNYGVEKFSAKWIESQGEIDISTWNNGIFFIMFMNNISGESTTASFVKL